MAKKGKITKDAVKDADTKKLTSLVEVELDCNPITNQIKIQFNGKYL